MTRIDITSDTRSLLGVLWKEENNLTYMCCFVIIPFVIITTD